ncbi:MAG: radical SAM family heme chaperone HemW [Ruminococcus sp.]|nr:radical SAM family heme chaperone HemW [Ruminococcus sp.]
MTGIYIHVPFCKRKCPYCAFYSVPAGSADMPGYLGALADEIKSAPSAAADTVYFGGGTPSLLTPGQAGEIIRLCREHFDLADPEITLEANPCTLTPEDLAGFREAGVNRLSVGVQSLDDGDLGFLGRLHNAAEAVSALENAVSAGFENISADLMIGIRGQSGRSLSESIARLAQLGAKHISVYMIKAEPGTAFAREEFTSRLCDDDGMAQLYLAAVSACREQGLIQYEISNFAVPGYESRHNLKYWKGEPYLGFGPSAHSFFGGVRYKNADSLGEYMSPGGRTVTDPAPDRAEEYVMLGLRLSEGISLAKAGEYGMSGKQLRNAADLAKRLAAEGLCTFDGDALSLTPEGMLVSNSIIAGLLA